MCSRPCWCFYIFLNNADRKRNPKKFHSSCRCSRRRRRRHTVPIHLPNLISLRIIFLGSYERLVCHKMLLSHYAHQIPDHGHILGHVKYVFKWRCVTASSGHRSSSHLVRLRTIHANGYSRRRITLSNLSFYCNLERKACLAQFGLYGTTTACSRLACPYLKLHESPQTPMNTLKTTTTNERAYGQ